MAEEKTDSKELEENNSTPKEPVELHPWQVRSTLPVIPGEIIARRWKGDSDEPLLSRFWRKITRNPNPPTFSSKKLKLTKTFKPNEENNSTPKEPVELHPWQVRSTLPVIPGEIIARGWKGDSDEPLLSRFWRKITRNPNPPTSSKKSNS